MANPYQTPDTFNYGQNDLEENGVWVAADIWSRVCAFLIDAVIFLSLFIGIGMGVHMGLELVGADPLNFFQLHVVASLGGIASFVTLNWAGWKSRGQSFGMKALRLYIVRKSWEPCSIARILLRTVPVLLVFFLVPVLGFAVGFVNAICIFRVDERCLHDDLADTAVIRLVLPKNPSLPAA